MNPSDNKAAPAQPEADVLTQVRTAVNDALAWEKDQLKVLNENVWTPARSYYNAAPEQLQSKSPH